MRRISSLAQLVIILSIMYINNVYESKYFLEPLMLKIGNEYNLNNVKEISVTDDFLTLDKTIINCQNEETLQDCQNRKYSNTLTEQCKCLPFAIRNENEVIFHHIYNLLLYLPIPSFQSFIQMFVTNLCHMQLIPLNRRASHISPNSHSLFYGRTFYTFPNSGTNYSP